MKYDLDFTLCKSYIFLLMKIGIISTSKLILRLHITRKVSNEIIICFYTWITIPMEQELLTLRSTWVHTLFLEGWCRSNFSFLCSFFNIFVCLFVLCCVQRVGCPSIYGFWLPLWYLETPLMVSGGIYFVIQHIFYMQLMPLSYHLANHNGCH
jgi:hypothetical protein